MAAARKTSSKSPITKKASTKKSAKKAPSAKQVAQAPAGSASAKRKATSKSAKASSKVTKRVTKKAAAVGTKKATGPASKKTTVRATVAKKSVTKKSVAKVTKKSVAKKPVTKVARKSAPLQKKTAKAAESSSVANADAPKELRPGQRAPSFSLPDQTGRLVSSKELAGKPYVLYFYPKDNTPGCTQEACDFRDHFAAFTSGGIRVFGVSPDSAKSHAGFSEKFGLPFQLLVDSDKELASAYGVWAKKKNYGREYMGIVRSTFLIGADGRISQAWYGVRVSGHVEAVLAAAREME